jgi:hypothetical protein
MATDQALADAMNDLFDTACAVHEKRFGLIEVLPECQTRILRLMEIGSRLKAGMEISTRLDYEGFDVEIEGVKEQ